MENWNTPLIQLNGELYFVNNELSSFDLKFVNGSNIDLVGYSDSLKFFLVRFNNQNRFIYKDVPRNIFDDISSPEIESIGSYMNRKVKGFFRYEQVDWNIIKASLTDVCKHYRNMQYNLNISLGCHATDRPDLFIGMDDYMWQIEYQEQPDNCQRIK